MYGQADGQAENILPPALSDRGLKTTVYPSKTSKAQYKIYLMQCFNNVLHNFFFKKQTKIFNQILSV